MKAHAFALAAMLIVCLGSLGADLSACGDKSLSAGGIRMQRALAARYPASVLIYAPAASRIQGATHELRLQETLLKVGHKYRQVTTPADFQTALATGEFNVVLSDVGDVPDLQERLAASPARATVVAVAYKLTKAEVAEAAKMCRFVIKAPGHAGHYLTTIADAVRSRNGLPRRG